MPDPEFSVAMHRYGPARYFEDLAVEERFHIPARTLTEANFAAFQTVSCDNHPIHYDAEYCRRIGHSGLLAHGLQVLCFTAAGAGIFPHALGESLIAFLDVSARFLNPVYAGDTLYPMLVITELTPQRSTGLVTMRATVHNQKEERVLEGMHRYLVKRRHPEK
ncbi:MAG: MaoC family dehydratase [Proteobacteria bacterium]|nr:MaoC family dehydratase [Pseudomonadota bacterium]